ncbi:MAG: hypothetical protein AAF721_12600 [Myxococcota bacterium]
MANNTKRFQRWILAGLLGASFGCSADDAGDENLDELATGEGLGKQDNAGVAGLPVDGNYASSSAWKVLNQWEDTDTPAAREAGMAWEADSGLNWDEKYAAWVESLKTVEGFSGTTFEVTNPWGKTIQAAKLDCADVALTLRASFAAWYNLPFFITAFDAGKPIYFGHFGIRTKDGNWNNMPNFSQFADHSAMGEDALGNWPQDSTLRKRGVQSGDDQPFLGEGARTGTWLDELHLNKKAARFIRLTLIFTGSPHLADSRNTFNLAPEAVREGDVNLHRWQAQGIGHTMFTLDVDELEGGKLDVRLAEGSLPPIQPHLLDATASALRLSNPQAGGQDDSEDYAPFNGGIKRFRVAKNVGGFWTNTWMAADEASWVNDKDLDRMRARPETFKALLGEVSPEEKLAALVGIVEQKREHLQNFPASCSARIKREEAFDAIYDTAAVDLNMSRAEVDAMWRHEDDYIFAELVYTESKTCCWNSSNNAMYESIKDFNANLQKEAAACLPPVVFKATDGGYEQFKNHNPNIWVPWSEDELCNQRDTVNDREADHGWTDYCEWRESEPGSGEGGGEEGGGEEGGGEEGGDSGGDPVGSCEGNCGSSAPDEVCWCDDFCTENEDCCDDFGSVCE